MKQIIKNIIGLDMEATGKRISQMIVKSGFSDKYIGEIMGISPQAVNKWRHGRSFPDIENLYILSSILSVKVDDLLVPRNGWEIEVDVEYFAVYKKNMYYRLAAYYNALKQHYI